MTRRLDDQSSRLLRQRNLAAVRVPVRAGLAPLELVLSLFFLLVMMALISNFGTIAAWHVRGSEAGRYAAWRSVSLRTGGRFPNPPNWVAPATMGALPGNPINPTRIDQIWWGQGEPSQAALRGPAVVDPATGNMFMMGNQQYLEMANQSLIGSANLTRQMPLLPNLRKSNIRPLHPLVDPFWRFEDMSPKTNSWAMRNNADWRLIQWYQFEASQLSDGNVQNAYSQYKMSDQRILQYQGIPALQPLDRDDEFIAAGRSAPPDFYPSVSMQCEGSPANMQMNLVMLPNGVIRRIKGLNGGGKGGVPENMAKAFISLYQQQLQARQQQQPPNQQLINQLEQKIRQLQDFIATLN